MAVTREMARYCERFNRAQAFTTTPGPGGWTIADTSSSGTPTYLCATEDGGAAVLTLASTSEAENVCLFHNDVLNFDVRSLIGVEIWAKVSGIDSATTLVMGLGSARNDTPDSVATLAWFRMEGSASTTALLCETDDATTDKDDVATGTTLASTYKKLYIDFSYGIGDVRFYIDGERVAASTLFDMSNLAAGLNVQPMIQIQKASGTGTPAVTIRKFEIEYREVSGS